MEKLPDGLFRERAIIGLIRRSMGGAKQPEQKPVDRGPFVANDLQLSIMAALAGQEMGIEQLAETVGCETARMYKPGGLTELRDAGFVNHKPSVGFYLPGDPPAKRVLRKN